MTEKGRNILGMFKDFMNARACITGWQCEHQILFSEKLSRGGSDGRNMLRALKTKMYIKVWSKKLMEVNTWVTKEKMGRQRYNGPHGNAL